MAGSSVKWVIPKACFTEEHFISSKKTPRGIASLREFEANIDCRLSPLHLWFLHFAPEFVTY